MINHVQTCVLTCAPHMVRPVISKEYKILQVLDAKAVASSVYENNNDDFGPQFAIDRKVVTGNTLFFHSATEDYP